MQAVALILLLISVGTLVGPIGAVAVVYRNNLAQVVVPPQLNDIINGNILNETTVNETQNNGSGSNAGEFMMPIFVGANVDNVSRTFSITVNFTNTFNFDLTLNSLSANVVCSQHNYSLGSITLAGGPIQINSGETHQVTVSGVWTQDAENHVKTEHPNAATIDVNLVNLTVDVNGITIVQSEPVSVPNVPLT